MVIAASRWVMREKRQVVVEGFDFDAERLGPRQVAIAAQYTAVSPGTECANYLALDPDVYAPTGWCRYPWPAGYAGAGVILAVGKDVREFAPGDEVAAQIGHASHFIVDIDQSPIQKRLPGLPPQHAAFTRIIAIAMTAYQVLQHAAPMPTVGVWGLGMIGNFVSQILHACGGRVMGIDPVPLRRQLAKQCGIDQVCAPNSPDFDQQVQQFTSGQGFDVTVEVTGINSVAVTLPNYTRRLGHLVIMTHWRSQPVIDTTAMIHGIFWRSLTVHGAHDSFVCSETRDRWLTHQREKFLKIQQMLVAGRLHVAPLISHIVRPDACQEVYEGLCFNKDRWWGVTVDWSGAHTPEPAAAAAVAAVAAGTPAR